MSKDRPSARGTVTTEALPETRSVETLSPAEERALRMRQGRSLAPDTVLARKAEPGTEAATTLLEMEAELLRAMRARRGAGEPEARPVDSPTKAKIVRALRKKR